MTHQTEPQLICLTCGSINPSNATGCQSCVDAARKSNLMPAILLEELQVCAICGRQDHGIKIDVEQRKKHLSRLVEIGAVCLGIFCKNCGSYYCRNEKLPKMSIWTGYEKAICPVCKERVGAEELLYSELTSKVVARMKSDLARSVSWDLGHEKWMKDPYQKQILLTKLHEVGPQVIELIFEALDKKNNLFDVFQLARIAEIGAKEILVDGNVEIRLLELPQFHDIFRIQVDAVFRLEKSLRSGNFIPFMIEELLNRKNDVEFRAVLAVKLGEITWDVRVVEGLKLALNDIQYRAGEASISGLFTHIPTVAELAAKSLYQINLEQHTPR